MATATMPLLERLLAPPRRARGAPTISTSTTAVVSRVKEGLSADAFTALCEAYGVSRERMAAAVQIPLRTLARRTIFKPEESERIVRLGRLFEHAKQTFGTVERTQEWMLQPRALFNERPALDFADTEPGAREVEAVLGRLEHGVFQ